MPASSYLEAIRTARAQAIADAIDAGAGAGTMNIYGTPRPADANAAVGAATLLATVTFTDPCAASVAAGVLTFDTITGDADADATGVAVWGRIFDSNGVVVMDVDVNDAAGPVVLDNGTINLHDTVDITSFVITEGNA